MVRESKLTVKQICEALQRRHEPRSWIFVTEVPTITGASQPSKRWDRLGGERRIDAFAMALWPSLDYKRVAYEIKTQRADWLRELKDPLKRVQAYTLSDEFYFVFGPDVFNDDDWKEVMHERCGIIEVGLDEKAKILRHARKGKAWPMPEEFMASLLRRVRDEARGITE